MKVKYIGALRDYSGYGEAARHDVAALNTIPNIELSTIAPQFTVETADYGELGEEIMKFENREIEEDVIIMHVTPNIFGRFYTPGKYHIGRVFWETDKIPQDFTEGINKYCDEVWTGSNYNKEAIIKGGVTKPVFVIPQAIDTSINPENYQPYLTTPKDSKQYTFYSIFEWTERKNPLGLLEAYFTEFSGVDDVALVIKTYVDDFTRRKRAEIDNQIQMLKAKLGLSKYPKLHLYRNLMDRHGIYRLHRSFDCFVSAHRGEGWGIPQMEALLMGNPVISTACGGIHEYLQNAEHAALVSFTLIPLQGNTRNQSWYTSDQQWAEADIHNLRSKMGYMYANQKEAQKLGQNGSKHIRETLNLATVGDLMKNQLMGIYSVLKPDPVQVI